MNRKYFIGIINKLARYLHHKKDDNRIKRIERIILNPMNLLNPVVLFFVILIILAGCGRQPTETLSDRTLRIGGLGGRPGPVNQIITNQTVSSALHELVFSRLVRINSRMLPEPDLAECWQVSPDGLTYTFYLRKGVKFHDGVELTARDCAFTYNAVLDPVTNSPWRDNYSMIKTVRAEDTRTFTVTLKEPQASFINLMNFSILPKHLLDGKDIRTTEFNRHPIGTGPFRFKEWTANDRIILERNQDYYEDNPQRSTLVDRIEARGYDTFPQYFSAFMKQETDIAFFLNQEQFETVRRDPEFRTYNIPYIFTYAIDYNLEHPLFRDKKVRQAIAHAIDIRGIINKVESGYGIQSTGPFLPNAWFSNPEVKPLEYNPAKALELLKEAGWEMNDNGILVNSQLCHPEYNEGSINNRDSSASPQNDRNSKLEFRFTLLVDPKERATEMLAKIIYQELYKIGIRMEIRPFDSDKAGEEENKELLKQAGAFVTNFKILADIEPQWHSTKQTRTNKWWKYYNPELDKLFERANTTYDLSQRQEIYHQLHRMVYDAQPATFLYFHPNLGAVNARLANTDELFSPAMPFYTIKEWGIHHKGTKDTKNTK